MMTELSSRDTSARSIRNALAFATNEQFQRRLIIEIQTRLRHLGTAWDIFTTNHHTLEQRALDNDEQEAVQQHQQLFDEIEAAYLQASGLFEGRLQEHDQIDEQFGEKDQETSERESIEGGRNNHEQEQNDTNNERIPPGNPTEQPSVQLQMDNPFGLLMKTMYEGVSK